jgi:hypothetical protein
VDFTCLSLSEEAVECTGGVSKNQILNTQIIVRFTAHSGPLRISASTATLITAAANSFLSDALTSAGIDCRFGSNVTLQAEGDGSWTVTGGRWGAGIGAGEGQDCGSLTIVNGTIDASCSSSSSGIGYGAGIGSGYGDSGNSTVTSLTILNGNITATSSSSPSSPGDGAGIGGGYGDSGNSTVTNLTILNGNITATSSSSSL